MWNPTLSSPQDNYNILSNFSILSMLFRRAICTVFLIYICHSLAADDHRIWEEYLRWGKENKVKLYKQLDLKEYGEKGLGWKSSEYIKEGDSVMQIPHSLFLSIYPAYILNFSTIRSRFF
jgi:hypothetical protein